jgi:hypothetical protein
MTKLLNIALMRQDIYHEIWKIIQSCSRTVVQSFGFAVLQFCSRKTDW